MDKHHLEKDNRQVNGEYNNILFLLIKKHSFYETLSFTEMSHLRNLVNALEQNPIRIVDNVSQALDMVER
jgi:hypothetical protein